MYSRLSVLCPYALFIFRTIFLPKPVDPRFDLSLDFWSVDGRMKLALCIRGGVWGQEAGSPLIREIL